MKHAEWIRDAFLATSEAIASCYNEHQIDGWSENIITNRVMGALKSLGLEINWTDKAQKVKWEGYKLRGKAESTFGDIALVVKIQLAHDAFIEGVAFYEAKRQFFQPDETPIGFTSIKLEQLSRIGKSTHAANILLYDVDRRERTTMASSVSTTFVESLLMQRASLPPGRILHHYGDFWVRSIANNFIGLNLDFSPAAVSSIKESVNSLNRPAFVLNASVAMTKLLDLELDNSFIKSADYEHWLKNESLQPNYDAPRKDDGPKFGP